MQISESPNLTNYERLVAFSLINMYELLFGFIFGMISNEISYFLIPHVSKENFMMSVLIFLIFGTAIINGTLYIRRFVRTLPVLDILSQKEDFSHPPPIALTFGFWMTQNQLKSRANIIQNFFFKFINSPVNLPK